MAILTGELDPAKSGESRSGAGKVSWTWLGVGRGRSGAGKVRWTWLGAGRGRSGAGKGRRRQRSGGVEEAWRRGEEVAMQDGEGGACEGTMSWSMRREREAC